MYALARDERDGRGQDTYMHYIHRLPGGAKLLAGWQKEQRLEFGGDSAGPVDREPPPSRDVPF